MKRRAHVYKRQRNFDRGLRVAEFIRKTLTDLLRHKARDPRLASLSLTITGVEVSKDLAYANIYVASSEISDDESAKQISELLSKASGFFRSELAHSHEMRTTPELRFKIDRSAEHGARIDELLAKARYS